ncbi:hypothetical protein bas10_0067 [Escherichia phage IsaakIselin]|uniref:Uncharacterized protein n=1 Tax=Escherichia phage IsaakIselin TaxID=2851974 RepID=A0AAE7VTV3_9CAUD|nr:hypothetical protein bas10_0067 [Escherichia phage IsaakIselin]
MKSRKYRNIFNNLTYWLEDGAVMVSNGEKTKKSLLSAEEFFIAVGRDVLVLIEGE